ncbi:DUF4262 domain-containing protein [Emticicia sp. TH156]|uniref:DUF4262 domain-containing protein n=1 Tax=Emticicia sp. TH156 TaxID=2067454 RepID=UPI001303F41A|nr:DUF4262 domain-containing protein [Emticicia sp. TH156]
MKPKEKIINDIQKYGWHVVHILDDDRGEKYSYTIGLTDSFKHPEIAISGLKPDICSLIFEGIVETIKDGFEYKVNKEYDDILEGYNCIFRQISDNKYDNLFGKATEYYKEKAFNVYQLFYPDNENNFPWDNEYSLTIQELL